MSSLLANFISAGIHRLFETQPARHVYCAFLKFAVTLDFEWRVLFVVRLDSMMTCYIIYFAERSSKSKLPIMYRQAWHSLLVIGERDVGGVVGGWLIISGFSSDISQQPSVRTVGFDFATTNMKLSSVHWNLMTFKFACAAKGTILIIIYYSKGSRTMAMYYPTRNQFYFALAREAFQSI